MQLGDLLVRLVTHAGVGASTTNRRAWVVQRPRQEKRVRILDPLLELPLTIDQ
jgi:hypothetical protein